MLLLALLRNSLWGSPLTSNVAVGAWGAVVDAAALHAVVPMIWPAMRANAATCQIPDDVLQRCRSAAIASALSAENYMAEQTRVLDILNHAGIDSVVHKGASMARLYPKPEMRSLGDIDLLVRDKDYIRSVNALVEAGYRLGSEEHPYHKVLFGTSVMVEIHCAVARTPEGKAGQNLEKIMASALDDAEEVTLNDARFHVLAPGHQAVALLMHMQKHMVSSGIGLRQLCDWMMFVHSVGAEQWPVILPLLDEIGLKKYAMLLTKTCILYLGLPSVQCEWCASVDDKMCKLMIDDIMRSGNVTSRKTTQGLSSVFLEDVGHFDSPFHGTLRKYHVLLHRLNGKIVEVYPKLSRIIIIRPVLWMVYGIQYIKQQKGMGKIVASQKIADSRRCLYDSVQFFTIAKK